MFIAHYNVGLLYIQNSKHEDLQAWKLAFCVKLGYKSHLYMWNTILWYLQLCSMAHSTLAMRMQVLARQGTLFGQNLHPHGQGAMGLPGAKGHTYETNFKKWKDFEHYKE